MWRHWLSGRWHHRCQPSLKECLHRTDPDTLCPGKKSTIPSTFFQNPFVSFCDWVFNSCRKGVYGLTGLGYCSKEIRCSKFFSVRWTTSGFYKLLVVVSTSMSESTIVFFVYMVTRLLHKSFVKEETKKKNY